MLMIKSGMATSLPDVVFGMIESARARLNGLAGCTVYRLRCPGTTVTSKLLVVVRTSGLWFV